MQALSCESWEILTNTYFEYLQTDAFKLKHILFQSKSIVINLVCFSSMPYFYTPYKI